MSPTVLWFFAIFSPRACRRWTLGHFGKQNHLGWFARFRIQFLPDHIMIHSCLVWFLWWLRHGAIGPIEATPVGVNVDWIDFRIYTFELVIRLSKVQLCPYCYPPFFGDSRCSGCPLWTLWNAFLLCEAVPNIQKPLISQQLLQSHCIITWHKNQAGTRLAGVVFFLFGFLVRSNILCT